MTFRPFRNVIVCHLVPGSEDKVGAVFGHYDQITRPQDLGVIGRTLLSHDDLYIHVLDRKQDPEVSGQRRGLPAFQQIAEEIGPFVTPYPRYWENPSHSVAKGFYSWVPDGDVSADRALTVVVQRMKRAAESDIARVFDDSDASPLPTEMGLTGRWLYSIDDLLVHLLEQDKARAVTVPQDNESHWPAFGPDMSDLSPYLSPYRADRWQTPDDSVANRFYRWQAEDWTPPTND